MSHTRIIGTCHIPSCLQLLTGFLQILNKNKIQKGEDPASCLIAYHTHYILGLCIQQASSRSKQLSLLYLLQGFPLFCVMGNRSYTAFSAPALPAAAAAPQDTERSGPEPGDKPVPIGDAPSRDRNAPPAPISNSGTTESGAAGPTPGPGSPVTPPRAPTPAVPPGPAARARLGPAWSRRGL